VVDQSSKRVNRVQRYLLIVGIVAVGVLDVAFTSYLNGIDGEPVSKTVARTSVHPTNPPVSIDPFEQPAAQDEPDTTSETSDSLSSTSEISHHYLKASSAAVEYKRGRHNSISSRRQIAFAAAPPLDCRVITYPFIGTGVYVQVTDNTSCLTARSSRNKRDLLFAKTSPSSAKRWLALNKLVAKLK